jgi:hypothetical protein
MELDIDLTVFRRTLNEYVKANKRESSDLINKKAKDIAFGAARHVKSATVPDINKLGPPHKPRKPGSRAKPRKKTNTLFHRAATKGNKFGKAPRGKGNYDLAKKTIESRKKATGYSKALFIKLAKNLMGKPHGFTKNPNAKGRSSIDGAKAEKSTPITLEANLEIPGLRDGHYSKVMKPALEKAIREANADMQKYLADKLQKVADKYS